MLAHEAVDSANERPGGQHRVCVAQSESCVVRASCNLATVASNFRPHVTSETHPNDKFLSFYRYTKVIQSKLEAGSESDGVGCAHETCSDNYAAS